MKKIPGPARVAVISILCLCMPLVARASSYSRTSEGTVSPKVSQLYFETRCSYDFVSIAGDVNDPSCGFKGKYLNFRLDGQISDKLSYSYRQRLNKNTNATFFDSTDWLHLDWKVTPKMTLSAGKQVVAIGGYEYDRAPIDLYFCSEFWNNIPCYQLGVSAAYNVTDGDQLLLQLCNTPMRGFGCDNKYALNLMWYGSHGLWETMWSANAIQCIDGAIYYLALGNRFNLTDWLRWDLDLMDRYDGNGGLLKDFSIMTELSAAVSERTRMHAKYTHDYHQRPDGHYDLNDYLVMPGTDLNMVSGGVEYHPLRNGSDFLKLYAVGGYSWGSNGNPDGTMVNEGLRFELGLKFRLDILKSIIR